MGVSMTWKPTDPSTGKDFEGRSSLHKALMRAFGEFPITLTTKDYSKLEGIAACGHEGVEDLLTAINEHDSIDLEEFW